MKKKVISLMTLVATVAALASCNKKEEEAPIVDGAYQYRFEIVENDTRATLAGKDGVFWEVDKDKVGIFAGSETAQEVGLTVIDDKKYVVLSSNNPLTNVTVNAFYPYAENTAGASNASIFISPVQLGGSVSAMPMAGIPLTITDEQTTGRINFLNLGGVIDFRVYSSTYAGETIESITFTASDQKIAGTATMNLAQVNNTDEDKLDLTFGNDGVSSVTLTQEGVVAASKDAAITPAYMVVAPFSNLSGTITIVTNAASYTFNFTGKSLGRSKVTKYNMNLDNATVRSAFVTLNLEEATELVAGDKYYLVSNGKVLLRDGTTASAVDFDATAETVTVTEDVKANLEWTLGKNTDSNNRGNLYDFKNGDYFFGIAMNTSVTPYTYSVMLSSSKTNTGVANTTFQNHNIDLETGYIYYKGNSSSQYIYFDTEAKAWNNHQESNGTFVAAYGAKLYKLKDLRAEQNPTFSADEAEYDLFEKEWTKAVPTLQDAIGTVTYESSVPTVATVDASGNVTPIKKGTAKITAKAAGNDEFKPGEASYTVKVVNSNPAVPKYYKVDEIVDNQTYIIVSGSKAMTIDGTNLGVADVTDVDGVIESDEDLALWTAAAHVENYSGTSAAGHFTLKNGEYYLQRYSNQSTQNGAIGGVPNDGKYYVWDYDGSHLYQISRSGQNGTYYIYYDSTWKFEYQSSPNTYLYSATKPLTKQTIAFAETNVQYDLNGGSGSVSAPEWAEGKAPLTTVTYATESTIVSVNESTGIVTVLNSAKKGDTATITATAEQTEVYASAKATFTINIVDSSTLGEEKYYVLVTSEPASWNGKYLIVNTKTDGTGTAMNGTSTASVTISGGKILSNETVDGYALTVASAGEVHPNQTNSNEALIAYDINFSDGDWLYWYSNKYKQTSEDQSSRHNKCTLLYDNGGVRLMSAGYNVNLSGQQLSSTPSKNYLYYSSSGYTMSSSHSNDRVQLYKLDDGGTTPEPSTPSASSSYTRISGQSELVTGTYLVVSVNNTNKVLKGGTGEGADRGAVVDATASPMSMSGNTITISGNDSVCEVYEYVITRTDNQITLKGKLGYLKHDRPSNGGNSTTYIGFEDAVSASSTFVVNTNPGSHISGADAVFFSVSNNTGEYLYYNTSGYYKLGGSGAPSGSKYGGVFLYKKVTTTE